MTIPLRTGTHMLVVRTLILPAALIVAAACSPEHEQPRSAGAEPLNSVAGTALPIVDTVVAIPVEVSAVAHPFASATLSTKLIGAVRDVLVREGDVVAEGQPLLRIDSRDIDAKRAQIEASLASAMAMQAEAALMATRMRSLHADSAVAKVQLDAAESALARADAAVSSARAGLQELETLSAYSELRAPFAGVITKRMVDPGTMAAPGMPLLTVQDHGRLRLVATVTPDIAAGIARGQTMDATVEGVPVEAVVEGVVPSSAGSMVQINAIAGNRSQTLRAGGAATLHVPGAARSVVLIPNASIRNEGNLTGVLMRANGASFTRWITVGRTLGGNREVLSGLARGDTIIVPAVSAQSVRE